MVFLKISIVFLALACANSLFAQERYQSEWFDNISKDSYTYATKDGETLDLDLYLPLEDDIQERPLLIYVHGGGFSEGARDEPFIQEFCTKMAKLGYAAASLSYRLSRKNQASKFGCDCPSIEKLRTFQAAVEDIQDATFFLIENRLDYGIDPQKIILAGSSAGAEAVLMTAFQPPYCYGLDSGPVSYAGVIGMAGAIPDTTVIYDESAVPALLFHGSDDLLVPYTTAPHHYCPENTPGYLILNGSKSIAEKLQHTGSPYWLVTVEGGGHEVNSTPLNEYFDTIVTFCYDFVINESVEQKQTQVVPLD